MSKPMSEREEKLIKELDTFLNKFLSVMHLPISDALLHIDWKAELQALADARKAYEKPQEMSLQGEVRTSEVDWDIYHLIQRQLGLAFADALQVDDADGWETGKLIIYNFRRRWVRAELPRRIAEQLTLTTKPETAKDAKAGEG